MVDTLDIILDQVDGKAVSLSELAEPVITRRVTSSVSQSGDGTPVGGVFGGIAGGEEKPNSRTYKVVRRVYTRGPYRGRQTIRQQVLKVNKAPSQFYTGWSIRSDSWVDFYLWCFEVWLSCTALSVNFPSV